jgi:hypothetical protein
MLFNEVESSNPKNEFSHKEGELYKKITAHGRTFEIYYGYYEEIDRANPLCEPMEIYPNFKKEPIYTDKGIPFTTAMQEACEHFKGEDYGDNNCYQCSYFEVCEELLGICKCRMRQKSDTIDIKYIN